MAALRLLGFASAGNAPTTSGVRSSADIAAIRRPARAATVASLLDLPRLEDPAVRQAIKLLVILWTPAYILGQTTLSDLVGARMVILSLRYGNCGDSAYGYVAYAMTAGWRLGDYALGHDFGRLGLALNDRLADLRLRGRVHHRFGALVNPWRRPFATSIPHAREAVRSGLESGDFIIAAYGQFQQSWWGMQIEPDLDGFLQRHGPTVDFLARMQAHAYREVQKMILQWARALQGRTSAPTSLDGDDFREADFLATYGGKGIFGSWYVTMKIELLRTFGAIAEARAAAREWEPVAEVFASSPWPAMFAFQHALVLCAWLASAEGAERAEALAKAEEIAARFRIWAANAPENFGHLSDLIAAEIARARGDASGAFERYEAALARAQTAYLAPLPRPGQRAVRRVLAGPRAARGGRGIPARGPLRLSPVGRARQGGGAGGAARGAAPGPGRRGHGRALGITTTTQTQSSALDLHTVIKVGQAIASEMDLEVLLGRLMRVAIEHAGAEQGHFVLEHDGAPAVHVTGSQAAVQVRAEVGTPLAEASGPAGIAGEPRPPDRRDRRAAGCRGGRRLCGRSLRPPRHRPRSIICTPLTNQGRLVGALYLENNLAAGVFTADRAQLLQLIAAQAAIAIENARLFAEIGRLKDRLEAENVYLSEEIKTQQGFEDMVGHAPALQRVLARVEQVAATDSTVLITGETGTGKELVARAIHTHSPRRDRPLVSVNCGAISPGLVESELFGHEKGAFTGALARKIGRFELADGGTLFLDEIGDLAARPPGQAAARAPGGRDRAGGRRRSRSRWTSASWRPPTATSGGRWTRGGSGRTSTTA